ncbi:MAG: hypothetical protein US65_C0046G0002 [Candidatus Yanofskybacteria bacterium GW2011_GWC2_37_9]|uniref:Uncharacterized protein n=1 Tax=Candidatus Yanofskybacteria bacterium GW2011_GWC2_37_9 TaxID=1619028 RepID=A0A0G0I4T3_9BACT|nr:MAG: hypothetical protein US65_C0046G0002 [Candidatus Yanofskybacteria bacterium GW2011_GWC2_37_9]
MLEVVAGAVMVKTESLWSVTLPFVADETVTLYSPAGISPPLEVLPVVQK